MAILSDGKSPYISDGLQKGIVSGHFGLAARLGLWTSSPTEPRALVRTMSSEERQAILNIFNEYIGPGDPHWVSNPCWPVPALELYMALMADRGY